MENQRDERDGKGNYRISVNRNRNSPWFGFLSIMEWGMAVFFYYNIIMFPRGKGR